MSVTDTVLGGAATVDLLVFETGGHRFAVLAEAVEHVVQATAIAALPAAPPIIDGVVNVRGELMPVIDVTARFGLTAAPLSPDQHFILAKAGSRAVALRVDRAVNLISVPTRDIQRHEQVAPGASHTAGIARLPDGVIVIQDLAQTLSLDEAAKLDVALDAALEGR